MQIRGHLGRRERAVRYLSFWIRVYRRDFFMCTVPSRLLRTSRVFRVPEARPLQRVRLGGEIYSVQRRKADAHVRVGCPEGVRWGWGGVAAPTRGGRRMREVPPRNFYRWRWRMRAVRRRHLLEKLGAGEKKFGVFLGIWMVPPRGCGGGVPPRWVKFLIPNPQTPNLSPQGTCDVCPAGHEASPGRVFHFKEGWPEGASTECGDGMRSWRVVKEGYAVVAAGTPEGQGESWVDFQVNFKRRQDFCLELCASNHDYF